MAQAIVDPGELRRFAQLLRRFNEELSEKSAVVSGQLSHLGQSWRDQEHQHEDAKNQQYPMAHALQGRGVQR